jgi:hypothetical protein
MSNKIVINGIQISKTIEILNRLDYSIKNKKSFALLRFGDGTAKAIHSFLNKDYTQLISISEQEGIPISVFERIVDFWKTSANHCNYIDTPEVYFSDKFWGRTKGTKKQAMSEKTIMRLKMWKQLYSKIGIVNESYCNPEVNFLSCIIGKFGKVCLPDLLKDIKICCITSRCDVNEKLPEYNIDVLKINGKFENQYTNSFGQVIEKIDSDANKYDLWLIAAGELGRIYPGLIKFKGGRAFDIGSVIDFWCGEGIPSRLRAYLTTTSHHPLKFALTPTGKEFNKFI